MAVAMASNAITQLLAAIPANAIANGHVYENIDTPSTVHVGQYSMYPLVLDAQNNRVWLDITRSVIFASGANEAVRPPGAMPIAAAVAVVVGRESLKRVLNLQTASINLAEARLLPLADFPHVIHANHEAEFVAAVRDYASAATRYFAIFFYNCISLWQVGHAHVPNATKKLAKVTISLAGLETLFAENPEWEALIMHDMFHPLNMAIKSAGSRMTAAKKLLDGVKFSNLSRRIPIKAPDSALAMNYAALYKTAKQYAQAGVGVPDGLAPPPALALHIEAYIAADAVDLPHAVMQLVSDSQALSKAACYITGYMLGVMRRVHDDAEMDLRRAVKAASVTILGSPALARVAGEFPGTYLAGIAQGMMTPDAAAVTALTGQLINDAIADLTDLPDVPANPIVQAAAGAGVAAPNVAVPAAAVVP